MKAMFFHVGEIPMGVDAPGASQEVLLNEIFRMRAETGLIPRITIIFDDDGKVVHIEDEDCAIL